MAVRSTHVFCLDKNLRCHRRFARAFIAVSIAAGCLSTVFIATTLAGDRYVHPQIGDDANAGTSNAPVATAQHAVNLAEPGDTIHLLPKAAVYRQSISLNGKSGLTIEGNGVTLDGADQLSDQGWEACGPSLRRRRMPHTIWNRHLLIFGPHTERMGRTQSSNSPDFPAHEQLEIGQFCFESIDDEDGWLYVRGGGDDLQWATRPNGFATSGENANIVVRNLNARHFLNDGFNLHGHAVDMRFERICGYDCFDEGFSAHDTCQCEIEDGRFWGNENAVADVNNCRTSYERCEFRDSVNFDVLLIGARHRLIDCRILNTTKATALSAGPRGEKAIPFQLTLERVRISGQHADGAASVRIDGGHVHLVDCVFQNVEFDTQGARVTGDVPTIRKK